MLERTQRAAEAARPRLRVKVLLFHTISKRIASVASCIEPYFSLQIHAKLELAHRLQTSKMRRNSTSPNNFPHDANIVNRLRHWAAL